MEAASVDSRTVSLTIPAKPDYVVLARLALSAVSRLTPLRMEEVADLKLAITESATFLLGGERRQAAREPEAGASRIRFGFILSDEALTIEVAGDEQPTVSADERELSMELIKATIDEHSYTDGTMRLTKRLDPAAE
jgi:anti-sigma regulatory factor (Ser/Thr protein kinase)